MGVFYAYIYLQYKSYIYFFYISRQNIVDVQWKSVLSSGYDTMELKRRVRYMVEKSLATRLRVLRAERRLTLREVEARTGVAKETISDIERGVRHPQDRTLAKLADFYGVPVEDLLKEPVLSGKGEALERAEPKAPRGDLLDELTARLDGDPLGELIAHAGEHGLLEVHALSGKGEAAKEERTIHELVLDAAFRTLQVFPSQLANAWGRIVGRGRFFSEEAFRDAMGVLMAYETAYRHGLGTVADREGMPDAIREAIEAVQADIEEWKRRLRDAHRVLRDRAIAERNPEVARLEEYGKFLERRVAADLPSTPPGKRETG